MQLSSDRLADLPAGIAAPAYDRAALHAGILHIGLGNFHRAHQAVYVDDLMAAGDASAWGILGAGVMPADAAMRDALKGQDWLYTVIEQDGQTEAARVVGAMTGFLPVAPHHATMVAAMADPGIRIVSLTVTEGGYFVDAKTGSFNADDPAIHADIAAPDAPGTVFGAIVAGLRRRREAGTKPFTVMSCDNLPHNGDVTRAAVLGIAGAQDPGLAGWIADEVAFPNGMVDRITPATTEVRRAYLKRAYGLDDACPVFCEPFRQWVLEDRFCNGRPALEEVGVEFVSDVTPYENMKIRILNGGHAILAYPAGLLGIAYAHEAMASPLVAGFLHKVERSEVLPAVPPVPGLSRQDYFDTIRNRFANPKVEDTIRRLCLDGSNRQPKFIVPSIADNLRTGRPIRGLALASALWCRYCFGTDETGAEIAPNDPNWARLTDRARAARDAPECWLEMSDIYGEVGTSAPFRTAFSEHLNALWSAGVEATLATYLGD